MTKMASKSDSYVSVHSGVCSPNDPFGCDCLRCAVRVRIAYKVETNRFVGVAKVARHAR